MPLLYQNILTMNIKICNTLSKTALIRGLEPFLAQEKTINNYLNI